MSAEIFIGVFERAGGAEAAIQALKEAGVPDAAIRSSCVSGTRAVRAPQAYEQGYERRVCRSKACGAGSVDVVRAGPGYDLPMRDRADGGVTVLAVRLPEGHFERIRSILNEHDPLGLGWHNDRHGWAAITGMPTPRASRIGVAGAIGDGSTTRHTGRQSSASGLRSQVVKMAQYTSVSLRLLQKRTTADPLRSTPIGGDHSRAQGQGERRAEADIASIHLQAAAQCALSASHLQNAAHHHREAAKAHETENPEEARHHARAAREQIVRAAEHATKASQYRIGPSESA